MMTPEQLEQLLIDRAMGECSPEVAGLLDAYLDEHADARLEWDKWDRLATDARRALESSPARLPPFPRERMQRRTTVAAWWRRGLTAAALAACVALGIFVDRALDHRRPAENENISVAKAGPDGDATFLGRQPILQAGGVEALYKMGPFLPAIFPRPHQNPPMSISAADFVARADMQRHSPPEDTDLGQISLSLSWGTLPRP